LPRNRGFRVKRSGYTSMGFLDKLKRMYRFVYKRSLRLRYKSRSKASYEFEDPDGIKWLISKGSTLDHTLQKRNGTYDPAINLLISKCDLSRVAVDVGANAGYWSLPLAHRFARVVSFEPEPSMRSKFLMNVGLNKHLERKIYVVDKAASDSRGETEFFVRSSIDGEALLNRGLSSMVVSDGAHQKIQVKTTTVSDECDFLNCRVGLLKIDVEGAESVVLKGAEKILLRDSPLVYWEAAISLDLKHGRENVSECFDFLSSLGYEHYVLEGDSYWRRIDGYGEFAMIGCDLDILSEMRNTNPLQKP
jgi:FkbM family methyltransferase